MKCPHCGSENVTKSFGVKRCRDCGAREDLGQ